MRYGIIGASKYPHKHFVYQYMFEYIEYEDIIVSGHSPANKYDNVDIWVEELANKRFKLGFIRFKPEIYSPKKFTRDEFFKRNKKIAENCDILIAFIPQHCYRSGAWNTIKYFVKKINFKMESLIVIDEYGKRWKQDKYPNWVKERERHYLRLDKL